MDALKKLWRTVQLTRPWKAWQRYSNVRGNLLAGGISYFAFFSIFPVIALAFTIFGFVLQDQPDLVDAIREAIDKQLPGFVQDPDNPEAGGLIPIEAPTSATLSVTGAVAVLGLLWAGLGWLGALRDGIRAIFGAEGAPGNFALAKLRDLGVLVVLGLGIVIAAAVSSVANAAADWAANLIGLGDQGWIVTLVGLIVTVLVNAFVTALMIRMLSGVDLPWAGVRHGAIFGGILLTILQVFGTRLIAGTMSNPLFASIGLVVGLLAFLNFISRAMLLAASWAANDLDATADVSEAEAIKLAEGPETPEQVAVRERNEALVGAGAVGAGAAGSGRPAANAGGTLPALPGAPALPTRQADRLSIASGAVIGAGATLALGALLKLVGGLVRRS
ncbi:YihY/virulence factor BrkB family protein [Janibacter sp. G1551]|uniref:YihY/virulence factor BrkB family protein n=1 Tax=Janibacter sp. G1551 TaxID=3420440 RepID=UPI003CFCA09A